MTGLIRTAAMLLGKPEEHEDVEPFAIKLVSYTGDDKRSQKTRELVDVVLKEVMPNEGVLGPDGLGEVMNEAKKKLKEFGGVTGYLDPETVREKKG